MNDNDRINKALSVALKYAGCDGDHHKAWVIDQMIRILTGYAYEQWVRQYESGEDGPETYKWNTGIAP